MTTNKKLSKAEVWAFEMLSKAREIIGEFENEGMSEDDILDVLTEACDGRKDMALDLYHVAKNDDLYNSFK